MKPVGSGNIIIEELRVWASEASTMATGQINSVIDYLRRVARFQDSNPDDGQLLHLFVARRDEAAFEALVHRHGPMVLGVCRRVLRNSHDAEDAFQATFLVLVRKAASLLPRATVGNWLYGVAYHTALKARAASVKRRVKERQAKNMRQPTAPEVDCHELQRLLDHELSRLPDKYREPVVLCDLEGKTRKDAARLLGCPEGTLSTRLSRARALLAKRLSRHGLGISGGALAAILCERVASAGVQRSLVFSTVKAASLFAASKTMAGGAISAQAVALTEGVLKAMLLTKLKIVTAVILMTGLSGAGIFCMARSGTPLQASPPEANKRVPEPIPKAGEQSNQVQVAADMEKLQGTWVEVSSELDGRASDTAKIVFRLAIEGNRYRIRADGDGAPLHLPYGTFTLDPTKQPKEIDFAQYEGIPQEKPNLHPGIYELDGATLKICMAYAVVGGKRPTDFTTKPGSGRYMRIFRRVVADGPKKGAPGAGQSGKERTASDLDKLQGTWAAVSREANGKVDPEAVEKGLRLIIEGNGFMLRPKLALHFPHGTFTLDAGKRPRAIDFTQTHGIPKEEPALIPGIYEFDGETLKICRGGTRPTDFTTKPGSGRELLVFRRPGVDGPKQSASVPDAWSETVKGLSGRLRIGFVGKNMPGGSLMLLDSQVELKNDSARPLAVPNHFLLEARVFDAAGKEIREREGPGGSAGMIPLEWRNVPAGGSLGGYISLPAYLSRTGSFHPYNPKGDGTFLLVLGEREWLLKPGRYRVKATWTVEKAKSPPADAWSGRLDLPPVEYTVTPEQAGLPSPKRGQKAPVPHASSRPVNGLCGRLCIVLAEKHIPASNSGGVITTERTLVWLDSQVEMKNESAKPVAVPNRFLLEARLFDAAGKEIKEREPLPRFSTHTLPLAWRNVPTGGSLGGYVSLPAYLSRTGSFVPLRSLRSRVKGDGTVLLFLGEREWLLKPGRYRVEATWTVEKAKSAPADAWSGRLELPPVEFAVTPEQVGLPPPEDSSQQEPNDL